MRVLPPSGHLHADATSTPTCCSSPAARGITPVMSITRTALEKGARQGRAVLRQPRRAVGDLRRGAAPSWRRSTPTGCVVVHWLESVQGLPTQEQLRAFASYLLELHGVRLRPGAVHEGRRSRRSRSSASRASGATRRSSSPSAATRSATSRRCRRPRRRWPTPTTTRTTTSTPSRRGPDRGRGRARRRAVLLRRLAGRQGAARVPRGEGRRRAVLLPRGRVQRLRLRLLEGEVKI